MKEGNKEVSGLRLIVILPWICIVAAAILFVFMKDIDGVGIKKTIIFSKFGYFAFPAFYGGMLYVLHHFASMAIRGRKFIYIDGNEINFGMGRPIQKNKIISIKSCRNIAGIEEISLNLRSGAKKKIRSYVLDKPSFKVLSEIREWLDLR